LLSNGIFLVLTLLQSLFEILKYWRLIGGLLAVGFARSRAHVQALSVPVIILRKHTISVCVEKELLELAQIWLRNSAFSARAN
jgi:hypothetical protein